MRFEIIKIKKKNTDASFRYTSKIQMSSFAELKISQGLKLIQREMYLI